MSQNKKLIIVGVLLLALAAVKLIALDWWQQQQPQAQQAECQVTQGCTLPNGVYVKFSDKVEAKKPFDIALNNVPEAVQEVTVSFSMKDMDMGFNRFNIRRQDDGTWAAKKIRLPMCVENRHDYLADINIDGEVFQTAFTAE
ncbi:hypothetical protein CRG49_006455 [Neisseria sp. N95_16]|uniref:Uncharacterized protein n=1 Tax=Neisseria brasiliensis TaxID=2666100 RepID=A0A7X2GX38_9NEIS|nr:MULTISPECIES: hypothetical protein [Neisseria]MRN37495.1 hypothetical protein [Neisseria brasiliensis]PJO09647.1 hypothetical protein CRG49_006455 [Neisseria sp. N95_16]